MCCVTRAGFIGFCQDKIQGDKDIQVHFKDKT